MTGGSSAQVAFAFPVLTAQAMAEEPQDRSRWEPSAPSPSVLQELGEKTMSLAWMHKSLAPSVS